MLDEAIQNFEAVLDTRIPERKSTSASTYEVINELAGALYARARSEPVESPSGGNT